ncbi:hypothetical protein AAE478_004412 [Parahypoxylon ruwenzoriense]
MDLAKKLLSHSPPADHINVISEKDDNILFHIAREFEDADATEAITKILSDCEQTGCNQCLRHHSDIMDCVIFISAGRGHIHLVRTFSQYIVYPGPVLSAAIRSGNKGLTEFLLTKNPDILGAGCIIDSSPATPLAEAIRAGDKALIKTFKEMGAFDRLHEEDHFESAVDAASQVGDIECLRRLLSLNIEISEIALRGAFEKAIENRHEEIDRLLLEAGASFSDMRIGRIKLNTTGPIFLSLVSTFPEFPANIGHRFPWSELLPPEEDDTSDEEDLSEYIDGNLREYLTRRLMFAVKRDRGQQVRRLLESGADALDSEALAAAVRYPERLDILRMLLEHIPPVKASIPHFGTTAVIAAIGRNPGKIEALEMLLSCKAVDFKYATRVSDSHPYRWVAPISLAIQKDSQNSCPSFPLTTLLLEAGCDINGVVHANQDSHAKRINKTPLLVAIESRNKSLVQFLIERGADVAVETSSLDIIQLLLQHGADVNGKPAGFEGGTALQFAAKGGDCNIVAILLDHGASLYASPSFGGKWPIEFAAEYGRLDMIRFLWNVGFGYFPAEQCRKAMRLAKENGHEGCKDLILELAVSCGVIPTLEGTG